MTSLSDILLLSEANRHKIAQAIKHSMHLNAARKMVCNIVGHEEAEGISDHGVVSWNCPRCGERKSQ